MQEVGDTSIDLIFTDPPYGLGTETIIRLDGKPDLIKGKGSDFMNKWEVLDGAFWEKWFREAYRVLKYGGRVLVFGLDYKLLVFKYYAALAGFEEQQSLYWYSCSSLPKSIDLSKRLVRIGEGELAEKYEGYRYSIVPLRQTNETILVFRKPFKNGSCLRDVVALEAGDETITCGALDIERNRIGDEVWEAASGESRCRGIYGQYNDEDGKVWDCSERVGRFPTQTFIDEGAREVLDKQGDNISRMLYEIDLYQYSPKAGVAEREGNEHITVKPLGLVMKILKLFKGPDKKLVLDSFAGSGTTGVACKELGLDFILIEKDEDYYNIATRRIEQEGDITELLGGESI
jgi:DNA modification methylase